MESARKPLRVAVLGAGPAGTAMAAQAASCGHEAVLWSPRGGGTRHILGSVTTRGALAGRWPVRVAADLGRAMEGADAVLICLPPAVLPGGVVRIAGALRGDPALVFAPSGGLAALLLQRELLARGGVPRIGALPALPLLAQRNGDGSLSVTGQRPRLWLAGLPAAAAPALAGLTARIFGVPVEPLPDMLAAGLAEPMALLGAARLLAPARMEEAPLRLLAAFGRERDALAAACGRVLPGLDDLLAGTGPLPDPPLAETLHGLEFLAALGRATRTPLPLLGGALALLKAGMGGGASAHPVLAALDGPTLARALG
jgi:hypothetical protein